MSVTRCVPFPHVMPPQPHTLAPLHALRLFAAAAWSKFVRLLRHCCRMAVSLLASLTVTRNALGCWGAAAGAAGAAVGGDAGFAPGGVTCGENICGVQGSAHNKMHASAQQMWPPIRRVPRWHAPSPLSSPPAAQRCSAASLWAWRACCGHCEGLATWCRSKSLVRQIVRLHSMHVPPLPVYANHHSHSVKLKIIFFFMHSAWTTITLHTLYPSHLWAHLQHRTLHTRCSPATHLMQARRVPWTEHRLMTRDNMACSGVADYAEEEDKRRASLGSDTNNPTLQRRQPRPPQTIIPICSAMRSAGRYQRYR